MKNRFKFTLSLALAVFLSPVASWAANDTGNPAGAVDITSTCQLVTGWSYDADFDPVIVRGCTNMTATNYDKNANVDDGSCTFPQEPCVSRYRWVNITAGTVNQTQGCAAVGALPMEENIPGRGFCASGESRPTSGYNVALINYSRGIWGGGNGGGGTLMPNQGGYRCYLPGQKQDRDNTDVTVAYYCDFGESFPTSCPADNPPPRTYTGSGGGETRYNKLEVLHFNPGSLLKSLAKLIRPFRVIAASSDSNSVEIYDGPKETTGNLIATVPADIYRADVNATLGITGNHGFSWSVPASLADGTPRKFYFYGTDIDIAGKTSHLKNSPMTFICTGSSNSSPSTPSLSCPASGSVTGTPVAITFLSTDADNEGVRYLVDWDANSTTDQYVPSNGYAPSGETQSASRTWSTAGTKTVKVTAQDSQGNLSSSASCTISVSGAECSENCGTGDPGDGGPSTGGENPQVSGFTVSGTSKLAVQFLSNLSAKTQEATLSVNPVNHTDDVTLSVASIRSAQGAGLPEDVIATYYFGSNQAQSMKMRFDGGYYKDSSGGIGTSFAIEFSKKIDRKYYVTIVGVSGSKQAQFVIEIEPSVINPGFREF